MKIGIIIQARSGSQRLPNKILKPFYQTDTILDIQIKKLKQLSLPIVVATTKSESDSKIVDIAKKHNVLYFTGSENNVLSRFIDTAQKYQFTHLVRICSDNPFLSLKFVKELIPFANQKYDYVSHYINEHPSIITHWGIFGELVSLKSLQSIENKTNNSLYLEHVTNYIHTHPKLYSIKQLAVTDSIRASKNIRLTVDTESDFLEMKKLYQNYFNNFDDFEVDKLLTLIDPILLKQMQKSIANNSK
ncbi:MAG: cytidylyltransferase domain-containing protein [Flavobacteriales bacterium]